MRCSSPMIPGLFMFISIHFQVGPLFSLHIFNWIMYILCMQRKGPESCDFLLIFPNYFLPSFVYFGFSCGNVKNRIRSNEGKYPSANICSFISPTTTTATAAAAATGRNRRGRWMDIWLALLHVWLIHFRTKQIDCTCQDSFFPFEVHLGEKPWRLVSECVSE